MTVTKHDGRKEPFKKEKIENAVIKAAESAGIEERYWSPCYSSKERKDSCHLIGKEIAAEISFDKDVTVDEIHDAVEKKLMEKYPDVAKAYILYRQKRTDYREYGSDLNKEIARLYSTINTDNANAANGSAASKMYSVAEAATKRYNLARMNPRYAENHKLGRIYIHDNGYFGITFNCFFNPLGKMLKEGFSNGVGSIRTPKRIGSATALACIILQSSQNSMFGGR